MTVEKFMVFDVESIGLHGEGFAVAWVVVNRAGERLGDGLEGFATANVKKEVKNEEDNNYLRLL